MKRKSSLLTILFAIALMLVVPMSASAAEPVEVSETVVRSTPQYIVAQKDSSSTSYCYCVDESGCVCIKNCEGDIFAKETMQDEASSGKREIAVYTKASPNNDLVPLTHKNGEPVKVCLVN